MESIAQLYLELQVKHPQLNGRLERGLNLFNAGHVRKVSDAGGYVVTSANRKRKYTTFYHTCLDGDDVGWHCSCSDVQNGAPRLDFWGSVNRPICKHIIAAAIDEMVSEDTPRVQARIESAAGVALLWSNGRITYEGGNDEN